MTLEDKNETCDICLVEFTKQQMEEEENETMDEFLKRAQLSQFMPDSLGQPVEFYQPTELEGYLKDKEWRPSVSQNEVLAFQKGYFDYLNVSKKSQIAVEKMKNNKGK